ncbi:hypothetical protein Dimus_014017 [Dionaea muscipula]
MNYSYKKLVSSSRGHGFRLSKRRLSIQRLRDKFFYIIRAFNDRWRRSYIVIKRRIASSRITRICSGHHSLQIRKRNSTTSRRIRSRKRRNLIIEDEKVSACRLSSIMHTNSFYTEAITDCLEFIKQSSASVDDHDHDHDPDLEDS